MKNTDKIRQLLKDVHNNDLPRIHTSYAGNRIEVEIVRARWDCANKIRQVLALLPCPTCNDTGDSKASVIDDLSGGIVDTDTPCPRCGGTNGKHKQVDDPMAGNSHMLTKMQCPRDNTERVKKILSDAFTEYQQAYRIGETDCTWLYPRDKYPDVVSYMAAKVIEYLNP